MAITPDTKDWTWVLQRVCPECGFDVRTFPREDTGALIRANVQAWIRLLKSGAVGERPSDDVWSGLEYACHVRDVFRLYARRLVMMLEQDDPLYPNWDQDAAAVEARYGEQDPETVATELEAAGEELAMAFDRLHEGDWDRPGRRSDGARFTVESFARYMLHDPMHHVHDVRKGYRSLGYDEDGGPPAG